MRGKSADLGRFDNCRSSWDFGFDAFGSFLAFRLSVCESGLGGNSLGGSSLARSRPGCARRGDRLVDDCVFFGRTTATAGRLGSRSRRRCDGFCRSTALLASFNRRSSGIVVVVDK
jgi:hypothetical protein